MKTSNRGLAKIPSISNSYKRMSGGTPIISVGDISSSGPKLKSKKESALERYEAERAVREAEEEEKIGKDPAYAYFKKINLLQGKSALDSLNKEIAKEQQMKGVFSSQTGAGQDYKKWRNFQEVQSGSPRGQFLIQQRLAQIGGDVNSPEYKDMSSRLRNAQLAQKTNTLY